MTASTRLKGESWDRIAETLRVLDECGVTPEHLARIRNDRFFAHEVGAHIQQHSLKEPIYHNMIRNKFPTGQFFGIDEWQKIFSATFLPTEIGHVAEFPWSTDLLSSSDPWSPRETIAQTHFAFLSLTALTCRDLEHWPLDMVSLWRLGRLHTDTVQYNCKVDVVFAEGTDSLRGSYCEFRWNLARLSPVEEEISKLGQLGYQLAWPVEEALKRILWHALAPAAGFGSWHAFARTRSVITGVVVCVNSPNPYTFEVGYATTNAPLSLAIMRKRPTQE